MGENGSVQDMSVYERGNKPLKFHPLNNAGIIQSGKIPHTYSVLQARISNVISAAVDMHRCD